MSVQFNESFDIPITDYFHILKVLYWDSETGESTADVENIMKRYHPGNYRVVEFYDTAQECRNLKMVFDDPREQTLWNLKFGG